MDFTREEHNALDYLYVLVKWRRMIALCVLAVAVLSAGVSLVLPEAWTATTKLLPPEDESDQMGLSLLIGSAVPAGLRSLVGASTPSERLLTLLESRRVLGAIVDEHDLVGHYEAPNRDQAVDILDGNIDTEVEGDGTLTLEVTASTPRLAAVLANAVAAELDEVNRQYKRQQASGTRAFLSERRALMEEELRSSGRALQRFQEEHGLVDLEAQTAATVEVVETIILQLAEVEVKLGLITRQLNAGEDRRLLELETQELRKQLRQVMGQSTDQVDYPKSEGLNSLGPPLLAMPELIFEHTELTMDLKIREEIIRYLGTKLEEAKYREALNTPTLLILDPATPPETRSAPRRVLLVLSSATVSLVLSTILAFVFESWNRLARDNQGQLDRIRQLLSSSSDS